MKFQHHELFPILLLGIVNGLLTNGGHKTGKDRA